MEPCPWYLFGGLVPLQRQQESGENAALGGAGGVGTNPSLHALLNLLSQALNILPPKSQQHKQSIAADRELSIAKVSDSIRTQ